MRKHSVNNERMKELINRLGYLSDESISEPNTYLDALTAIRALCKKVEELEREKP